MLRGRVSLPNAWIVLACLLIALPCVVFRYLPMTDLPQHEAIVSIIRRFHDPAYGFNGYYGWALDRTLYVFPYALATGLAFIVPVKVALHITGMLAVVSFPLGMVVCLRALCRPLWLGLRAVPLVYHRAFFRGFITFCLRMGLAFTIPALPIGPLSRRSGWWVMALCIVSAVTHVYGLLAAFAYAVASCLVSGGQRDLLRRLVWTIPAVMAFVGWGVVAANAPGYGMTEWLPINVRLKGQSHSILGGFADDSENAILCAWAFAIGLILIPSFPITWGRLKRWLVHTRAADLFIGANIVAYLMSPVATPTAKFIHFRHAVLAAMMALLSIDRLSTRLLTNVGSGLVAAVAVFAQVNTWFHFIKFEREAQDFNEVLALLPPRSNIVQLTYDSKGQVVRSQPYLHFGAYAQAAKGGV